MSNDQQPGYSFRFDRGHVFFYKALKHGRKVFGMPEEIVREAAKALQKLTRGALKQRKTGDIVGGSMTIQETLKTTGRATRPKPTSGRLKVKKTEDGLTTQLISGSGPQSGAPGLTSGKSRIKQKAVE